MLHRMSMIILMEVKTMIDQNDFLSEIISRIEPRIIAARRHIHKNPELSFNEYNTMNYICKFLDEIDVDYKSGIAGTGVVATIKGTKPSNKSLTLLLRADMDALPIMETTDKPYASVNKGVMHACGHDAHTAILLGVCEILNMIKDKFSGYVKIVFQPGEETTGGAKPLIDAGVLDNPNVDACLALHMDPDLNVGTIRIKPGSLYASPDDFKITIKGRGGHGAEPQNCIDPIHISAHIINALMTIVSREINPFDEAVISIGTINSGTASNIIPETAEITGTARSLNNDVRETLKKRIGEISNSICNTFGAECDYEFIELFPPLINDEQLSNKLYSSACNVLGDKNCILGGSATMAGEDFSYFTQKVPSVLFKLGCRNEEKGIVNPLHSSRFDIDEASLKCGVSVFLGFVLDYLN